jgi:multicomponent K+:H+ antiporter subunit A
MLELLVALPFLLAIVVGLLGPSRRTLIAWLSALAPVCGLAVLASFTPAVLDGMVPSVHHEWIPQAGLAFSIRLDGLAWMFAGLVLGIGLLIVIYARYYLNSEDSAPRFFAFLLLFMGAMLGMVVAGNLLLLAVFWELTSISSFLLIGYWFHRSDAREGAQMALAITGAGGLALLGGVLLIGRIVGSYELDVVLASGDLIRGHALYPWACVLVLLGVFTKSAQFPFQFWLPHAMAAPTPVSAYLHSATMVKAGVFLLARMHPALADTDLWFFLVSSIGAITMLVGAWKAIFQHDLKGLLAYSTISHLGLITLLFGLSTPLAVVAGLFHIINHATFKASLFMAAGIIDHECKTRDIRKLHRLAKLMPVTSTLAIIAALAMAGIPLLNGFLSKEMFFALALDIEQHATMRVLISLAALLAGLFGVAYSLRFVHDVFFAGDVADMRHIPHEPPRWMRVPVEVLVVLCVAVGMLPALTVAPVLHAAAVGVLGARTPEYSLAVWHGINAPLLMSLGGMVGGVLLYWLLRRYTNLHGDVRRSLGRSIFLWLLRKLGDFSEWLTAAVENGSLQRYLMLLVLAALALAVLPQLGNSLFQYRGGQPLPLLGALLALMLFVACAAVLRWRRQRLTALILIGAVGLLVSLAFALLSAPDLALTQLLVEMVTVALMLLALNYLPAETPIEESRLRRGRDALIAVAAGGGVAAMVYAVLTRPFDTVATEILTRSLPEGGGTNVVNVILVDFRGYDTLGEITVFGLAGLVVHALLVQSKIRSPHVAVGGSDALLIPNLVAKLLFPLALAAAIYLFLRGHNEPGGGFIAGLVLAVPLLLHYVLAGAGSTEERLRVNYIVAIALGLLIATATGAASWWFGYPFFTSSFIHPVLPLIGELPLASAMAFDLGVFLVVAGSALLALAMLGKAVERLPEPRP